MKNVKTVTLSVADLELSDRTRSRVNKPKEGSEIVQEYAEAYEAGLILEPLDVFCERGAERYIVADGEHRLLALRRAKIKEVECRLHEGGELDALRFALRTNQAHGLRLTKEDRYYRFCRIKETALEKEFRTDREISEALGVSVRQVQRYNVDWRNSASTSKSAARKKRAAQERAEKNTPESATNEKNPVTARPPEADHDTCHGPEEPSNQPAKPPSPLRPAVTRRAEPDDWTAGDAHTYSNLRSAWNRATPAARARLLAEVTG